MQIYQFTKEESSAIQQLRLDEALSVASVTFQRTGKVGKEYDYRCSDMEAFQALVESTLQRKESIGRVINQAMRDGTLQEAVSSEACEAS
jgi:hypothetical protein